MATKTDPLRLFKGPIYETPRGLLQTYYCNASDRIDAAKRCSDIGALEDALRAPLIQKSVQAAIVRRLKQI